MTTTRQRKKEFDMGYPRTGAGARCQGCGLSVYGPCFVGGCDQLLYKKYWNKFLNRFGFKKIKYDSASAQKLLKIVNDRFDQNKSKGRPSFLYHQTQQSLSLSKKKSLLKNQPNARTSKRQSRFYIKSGNNRALKKKRKENEGEGRIL